MPSSLHLCLARLASVVPWATAMKHQLARQARVHYKSTTAAKLAMD